MIGVLVPAAIIAAVVAIHLYMRRFDNNSTWREVLTNRPKRRRA